MSEDEPFYALLIAECENGVTGETKVLTSHFKFANEDLWNTHNDYQFDDLIEQFNDWLSANGYKNWYVNDTIETVRRLSATNAIAPVVVLD